MQTTNAPRVTPSDREARVSGLPPGHPLTCKVVSAARETLLWRLGAEGAMRHYGFRHDQYKIACRVAHACHPDVVSRGVNEREMDRLRACVLRAEGRYPLIHRRLLEAGEHGSYSAVASAYIPQAPYANGVAGRSMTRARAGQLARQLLDYLQLAGAEGRAACFRAVSVIEREAAGSR